ncbi:MAG: hypothetical protein AMJ81_13280 [Phycisphaerae bacterium SM23_33]|nr:MAG: hypothetical protein AMJ81_13280 [Phycisphaerae bacterium SM23_33]
MDVPGRSQAEHHAGLRLDQCQQEPQRPVDAVDGRVQDRSEHRDPEHERRRLRNLRRGGP